MLKSVFYVKNIGGRGRGAANLQSQHSGLGLRFSRDRQISELKAGAVQLGLHSEISLK